MTRPLTPCASPGCDKMSDNLFCPEHSRDENVNCAVDREKRPSGRAVWGKLKLMFLQANPMCVKCGRPATNVDYITPKRLGGDDSWFNLQSLCPECLNAKHEKGRLDKLGEGWGLQVNE